MCQYVVHDFTSCNFSVNNEELLKVIWKIPNWSDRIKISLHIRDWGIYLVVRDVINIFEKFTDKGELI